MATSDSTTSPRTCIRCQQEFPETPECFYRNKRARGGLSPRCKACHFVKDDRPLIPDGYKQCGTCKGVYPGTTEYFHRQARGKYGVGSKCVACTREYDARPEHVSRRQEYAHSEHGRAWFHAYHRAPETVAKERERYYRDHDKKVAYNHSERGKATRQRHRIKPEARQRARNYAHNRRQNPVKALQDRERELKRRQTPEYKEYNRTKSHARRARERGTGGRHTVEDVRLLYKSQKGRCWWCNCAVRYGEHHVDHIIPISRGGSNWPNNLCISCPTCNLRRRDRLPSEWNGRLF